MVDPAYLQKGLWALARAHRANGMTGHLGAALVAGCLFSVEHPDLDDRVHAAVQGELDRIIAGEEKWFDPDEAGVTVAELFEPMPDEPPAPERIGDIAEALSQNIDRLRQSGHNVIFACMAIRALHDCPRHATPSIIGGIRELVEGFGGTPPGRLYLGGDRGWIRGDEASLRLDDGPPPYADERAMAEVVVDELISSASEHRRGCGGLWHIINHAASLSELSRLGCGELARQGYAAHRTHVRLWRALPNLEAELGALKPAQHDPRTPEFWTTGTLRRDSALLTHRIKTLYGFFTLSRLVGDAAKRAAAEQRLLYLMG